MAKNYKSALATKEGTLKKTKSAKREVIRQHAVIQGHEAVIDKLFEQGIVDQILQDHPEKISKTEPKNALNIWISILQNRHGG